MSEANLRQVGGEHYKTGDLEHWDAVELQGVGYLEGCASKYVARFRDKAGKQDLEKAIHYVEKTRELLRDYKRENRCFVRNYDLTQQWCTVNKCDTWQVQIIIGLFYWDNDQELLLTISRIRALIAKEYP